MAASAALLAAGSASAAPTTGDTVGCFSFDFVCSSDTATVGPATEFLLNGVLAADFSDNLLTLTNISALQFTSMNATVLFSDSTSPFTTASVAPGSTVTNFGTATVNSNGRLRVQFASTGNGTVFAPGASVSIALAPAAAAVPEAASWAMMIVGFGAVGTTMRRRRTAASLA